MISPFISILAVYTLSLWLYPTHSPSVFYGFVAMVLLISLARGKDGQRIPGVIPGFVVLASTVMLLLYLPTVMKIDFTHFAILFVVIYCGLVWLLRSFMERAATRVTMGLVILLVLTLESRYYGDPGYAVRLWSSLVPLMMLSSLSAFVVTERL